jgi:hypothetical protein
MSFSVHGFGLSLASNFTEFRWGAGLGVAALILHGKMRRNETLPNLCADCDPGATLNRVNSRIAGPVKPEATRSDTALVSGVFCL